MSGAEPKNAKRKPPLNLCTDSNFFINKGNITDNVCLVYDVQNTMQRSQLPDEQKSNSVEQVVHMKKTKGRKPLFMDNNKTLNMSMSNFSDKHDEHCEKLCQNNNFCKCKFHYRDVHGHCSTKARPCVLHL